MSSEPPRGRCGMPMLFYAFARAEIAKLPAKKRAELLVEAKRARMVGWIAVLEQFEAERAVSGPQKPG